MTDPIQPWSYRWSLDPEPLPDPEASACEGPGPLACYVDEPANDVASEGARGASSLGDEPTASEGADLEAARAECELRSTTDTVLCGLLGAVAAARVGGNANVISAVCLALVHWVEAETPDEACRDE